MCQVVIAAFGVSSKVMRLKSRLKLAQLRDLDGIQSDHHRFMTDGQGDIQKPKIFNDSCRVLKDREIDHLGE